MQRLFRVGSIILKSDLNFCEKGPVILSRHYHLVTLFVGHYYDKVKHRGRHFTNRATRSAGWHVRTKRLVSSYTFKYERFLQIRWGPSTNSCRMFKRIIFDRHRRQATFVKIFPLIAKATLEHTIDHSDLIGDVLLLMGKKLCQNQFPVE